MNWPDDADGDVFRELAARKFDFSKAVSIDFTVDFETWPPTQEALGALHDAYGPIEVIPPSEEDGESFDGYVLFQLTGLLEHGLVTSVQQRVSDLLAPHGGVCESWGLVAE